MIYISTIAEGHEKMWHTHRYSSQKDRRGYPLGEGSFHLQ